MKRTSLFGLIILLMFSVSAFSQKELLYKQVDSTKLYVEVYSPEKMDSTKAYPAMVFFFGGGWIGGGRGHFRHQAEYFSRRGLVCFLVDYRTKKGNGTTPFESLKDAKSAMRFVRSNAAEFGIDPDRIVASGGSAGGHLAAATAFTDGYNEESDDLSASSVPNALVLFNPVVDNGPGGYGYERVGDEYKNFSPLHNIKEGAPPTIFMLGTKDRLIPVVTAEYYKMVMEKVGSRCDLKLYEGEGHGFFNYGNREMYNKSVADADEFLISIGYITGDVPEVEVK